MKPTSPPKLDSTSVKTAYGDIEGVALPATNASVWQNTFQYDGDGLGCDRTLAFVS